MAWSPLCGVLDCHIYIKLKPHFLGNSALEGSEWFETILGIDDVKDWKAACPCERHHQQLFPGYSRHAVSYLMFQERTCWSMLWRGWNYNIYNLMACYFCRWAHPTLSHLCIPDHLPLLRCIPSLQTAIKEIDASYDACNHAWAQGEADKFRSDKCPISIVWWNPCWSYSTSVAFLMEPSSLIFPSRLHVRTTVVHTQNILAHFHYLPKTCEVCATGGGEHEAGNLYVHSSSYLKFHFLMLSIDNISLKPDWIFEYICIS